MAVVLASLVGSGTSNDPFGVDGAAAIVDLRPDSRSGDGLALALLADGAPVPQGALVLSDAPTGKDASGATLSARIRNQLSNRLSLTVPNASLGNVVGEILLSGDDRDSGTRTRWRSLRASRRRRRFEVWLGGLLWQMPVVAGGAIVSDNFNRADSVVLGSSPEGWSWTEVVGNFDIVSNTASDQVGGESSARADIDLASDDHYAQAACVKDNPGSNEPGVLCRHAAAATTYYRGILRKDTGANSAILQKVVNGSITNLTLGTSSGFTLPWTIRLEVDGSNLELFGDGLSQATGTDTEITGNTRTGILSIGNTDRVRLDDFEAGDLGAVATDLTVNSTNQAQTAGQPALTQTHDLAADGAIQSQTAGAPALTQTHILAGSDAVQAQVVATPALTQTHELDGSDAVQGQVVELPTLTVGVQVNPTSAVQGQAATAPTLTQDATATYLGITVGPMREPVLVGATRDPLQTSTISDQEPVQVGAIRDTTPTVGVLRDDASPTVGELRDPLAVDAMRDPVTIDELRE